MAVSGKEKGKGKVDELDEERRVLRDKGKKVVLDKGKNVVRDDDEEEEEYENEEYVVDEAEEDESGDSSGEDIKVRRKKRYKRYKDIMELDEEDYDLLEDANVTGFRRPANLGGKFKRLKKAGHVPGGKDSGTVPKEVFEEEESEEEDEEEIMDDVTDEEVGGYELLSKSQKKGGRQAQRISRRSRRGVQKIDRSYKPPSEGRKRFDREALAVLNEEGVDSDDNSDNDQETLSRRLLEKQFEPSLHEVNYITARDDRLRQTDIPERLQILEEKTADALPSSDLELRQAAEWIFDRAFGDLCVPNRPDFQHLLSLEKPEVVRQIANVLRLVHNEHLEVPFIGLYRREECLDLLNEPAVGFSSFGEGPTIQEYKALWTIQEWNKKWLLIQRRKSALQVKFKERIPVDVSSLPERDKIAKNVFRFLEDAESEQALDDCEAQFNLHFPIDESEVVDCGFKRPRFRSLYCIGHQSGLGKITKYFGLTSEAFGDNVKAGYKRNGILDEAFLPDDLAAKFFSGNTSKAEFRDPISLIRGARHMLAMEISTEPLVREYVRTFYSNNALVTTRPTPVGIDANDAFHQFEGVKWISDKPVSAFDDEQWLLIQKAEEEKLIDVTVGLSKESINTILFGFEQLFSSDGLSRTSPTWSEQRKQILQEALETLLLPIMEKETRMSLVVRAKQVLVTKCGLQLWNKVSVAPPKSGNLDCRNEDGPTLRVLACCWGPPSTGTAFVMLGADGEILNIMHTGYLNIKAISHEQAQRKENDQARLMKVLLDYKPHIIVLGAARVQCRYLSKDISDVLFKVVEQHSRDLSEGLDSTKLVYGDETIPSLFEASKISQKQLPGKQGVVRRAVALGRFLQNPVAMVASLCGPSMEVLSIKFHPLQGLLSKEELYDIIERVMVTVVNQVGIDINLAAVHDWLFETLQFVAGLGPCKAEEIRRTLQMAGRVLTRDGLYSTVRAMDEKVFTNSAGFIRVRGIEQTSPDLHHSEPLDNTRIHPEWYQMAKSLAEAAIEREAKRNNKEADDDLLKMAVEYVMKNPNVLDSLDIEEYAQFAQIEGLTKRLDFIKSELQRGFQEWRKPYVEPSPEECFYLMTGESEDTLFEGRIVQATVRKVQEHQLMCVLECGLLGFIQKEDLSDDGDVEPKDKFTEGSSVICRVKEVKKDKYLVDLTCKESDLREDPRGDLHHCDKHFKPDATFLHNEQEKTRKKKEEHNKMAFKTRPIIHPKFQNLSTDDAIKALAEKDMGDFIIHPSSKGPAHLSIALKLSDGLFSHIDIAEDGKDNWDLASFLRLGRTLTIGDDSYKNLDEVISKHVNQIVTHLNAILNYRKYKKGSKSEISDALRSEKTEKPKCIPYCISIAYEYPGAFMLSYIKATNPYHEYISLVPSGFRFRKQVFDGIDKLVVYFQSHFHDPIPEAFNRGRGGRGRGDNGIGERDGRPRVCYAFQRGECTNGDNCKFSHEKQDERPRGVCYAFQRGDCTNGDDCKFLHEKQDERPRGVCYAFQRGECTNGDDCKFSHEKQDERPRGVCYAFQRGECTNGDDCKFSHEKQDERPRGVCYAFQRGECTNGDDCKFSHEKQDERPRGVCYAFQRGECTNGDDCKFLHEKQDERPRGVCYAFQRGECTNGDDCKFSHEKQDERPRGVCYAFQRGECTNGEDCKFLHEKQERPRGVCYAFQRGECTNGEDCKFLHEKQERPRGVCYAFQRGECTNGDDCKFSHEKQDESHREVCRAFKRGDCSRGDGCRFLHEKQDEGPREVCRAFKRGDCSRGDGCRFLHEKQDDGPREVCRAFKRGDCSRGDGCRFAHDEQKDTNIGGGVGAGDAGWKHDQFDGSMREPGRRMNTTNTSNSNGRGHDWNSGPGNYSWSDDRGTTSDTKGRDIWNDAADGERGSAWGDKGGISSNTGEAGDWGATNVAGGGGGGWDNWNDSADGGGGSPANAASAGGGWGSCNNPADGGGSAGTNAASKGDGAGWGVKWGIASHTELGDNVSKGATNAASRGGGWAIGEGESDKSKDVDVTQISGSDSAWDSGTKSIGRGDGGLASGSASGGGWDDVEVGHNEVSVNRSGGSDEGRWNENAGGGGEKTKRWGSDLWPPSPAKRPAHNSWGDRESTPAADGVGCSQDGGKPASNITTNTDAWGSVTNSAGGGGDVWDTEPASESGGWDSVQSGDKGGFNSHGGVGENWNQTGRDGLSSRRSRDQDAARRQEGPSSGWGSDLPPGAPSRIPIQDSWGVHSEPPASTDDGWGQSAEKGPGSTVVSGGDSGWGEPVSKETESAGPDWDAADAVADPWGSGGGGHTSGGGWGQQDPASGWNRQSSQRDQGQWGGRGGRGPQNDGGRWGDRGGRGSRAGGSRWTGRGGRGSQNESRHNSSDWD